MQQHEDSMPEEITEGPQSGSYFARHWRGDLSLARSWWFNGVVILGFGFNLLLGIVAAATIAGLRGTPGLAVAVLVGEVALQFLAYIWWLVGTWRAARKYQRSRVLSVIARILLVIGFVVSIARGFQDLGSIGNLVS